MLWQENKLMISGKVEKETAWVVKIYKFIYNSTVQS